MKDNRKNIQKYKPLPQIILASQSPRRKEILEVHGHKPVIVPAYVDEIVPPRHESERCHNISGVEERKVCVGKLPGYIFRRRSDNSVRYDSLQRYYFGKAGR